MTHRRSNSWSLSDGYSAGNDSTILAPPPVLRIGASGGPLRVGPPALWHASAEPRAVSGDPFTDARGTRRLRDRGADAVAESVQPRDAADALPIVVPSEPSVFEPTAAMHSRTPYSNISVGLSSVRFPSCHTPADGTSLCGEHPSHRCDTIHDSPFSSSRPPLEEYTPPPPRTAANRLWACVAPPLATVARCFMPELSAAESDPLAPLFTSMLPVTIPLFTVVVLRLSFYPGAPLSTVTVLYGTGCSLFSSILLYTVYPPPGTADGDRRVCFALLALCMSRLWMFLLAAETAEVFRAFGRIHGGMFTPETLAAGAAAGSVHSTGALAQAAAHGTGLLSATVYEWLEKSPDFITNVGIAAAGMPAAAVAGCFGTAIFSMAAGTGVMLLREAVVHGAVAWDATAVPWVALGFAVLSTARHAVLMPFLHRWRITWGSAIGMALFYAVYEIVYTWVCL